MAGCPIRRADLETLSSLTTVDVDDIFASLSEGALMREVAAQFGVGKGSLARWLESDPDRLELLKRARATASSSLVEETILIADGVHRRHPDAAIAPETWPQNARDDDAPDPDVQRDKLRIQVRQWTASRWNRDVYGEQKQPSVTVNLATLHLDALRQHAASKTQSQTPVIESDHNI